VVNDETPLPGTKRRSTTPGMARGWAASDIARGSDGVPKSAHVPVAVDAGHSWFVLSALHRSWVR
jgi:hypothetical protein